MHLGLLLAILLTGLAAQAQQNIDILQNELRKVERLSANFKNDTLLFRTLVTLSKETSNWEQARNYWQRAIEIAEKRSWNQGRLEAYKGMGLHYRKKGSFLDAADYFQRGLHLSETISDRSYQIDSHQALGVAYSSGGDINKSLISHHKALALIDSANRKRYLNCLNEIGNTYFQAKMYNKALDYYIKCFRINIKPVDPEHQCWFLLNIAATYQELNRPDSALSNYKKLFQYGRFLSKGDSILAFSRLCRLYIQLGKPDIGFANGMVAYRLAMHTQSYNSKAQVNQALSEAFMAKGDWKQAFIYERNYRIYSDSIYFQEQRQKLEAIRIGYESEKRRTELIFWKGEIKAQKKVTLLLQIGVTLFGLLVGVLVLFNYLLGKRRRKIEYQKDEISKINNTLEHRVEQRTAELQLANFELIHKNRQIEEALLRGQTIERKRVASELHDNLGGTLTAIQWYMESLLLSDAANNLKHEGYDDLYRMISRAYAEVRLLAHQMMPEVLEKQGLEAALQELASQINKAKRLHLIVNTKEVSIFLNSQQKFELYSIALELCTNIMKHAYASEASLLLDKIGQEIVMSVTDNGVGMSDNEQKQSMGLKNIQSRLETIGGYCVLKSAKDEGTTVLIRIPYMHSRAELVEMMDHGQADN